MFFSLPNLLVSREAHRVFLSSPPFFDFLIGLKDVFL